MGTQTWLHDVITAPVHYAWIYTVTARDSAMNRGDSPELRLLGSSRTAPPATPTGLVVTASDQEASLTWSANEEFDLWGYYIERTLTEAETESGIPEQLLHISWTPGDPGDPPDLTWEGLNDLPLEATSFHDFGLLTGGIYGYRVVAVNTAGKESPPCAGVGVIPADTTPPATPTGVEAQPGLAAGSIRVRWNDVPDADLWGYVVTIVDTPTELEVPKPATDTLVTGLNEGESYSFTVRSRDDQDPDPNESAESAEVSATTRSSSVAAPLTMAAESVIDDNGTTEDAPDCTGSATVDDRVGVRVTWSGDPLGPDVFRVYRAPAGTEDYVAVVQTADTVGADGICDADLDCTYFDEGVSGSVQYCVVAVDTDGLESAATDAVSVTGSFDPTRVAAYVYAVDGRNEFSTYNSRSRQVSIYWAPVAVAGLQGYHVYRKCDWAETNSSPIYPQLLAPSCSHGWQRLTAAPVTGQRSRSSDFGRRCFMQNGLQPAASPRAQTRRSRSHRHDRRASNAAGHTPTVHERDNGDPLRFRPRGVAR